MPSLGLGLGLQRSSRAPFTGLLDTYTGAAAAYSLRSLTRNWLAGDVVEVYSSGGGGPQSFTANQITNGELLTFVGAGNDGLVSKWYDQSGNGNDAVQAATTNQPKIVSSGSLVAGGLDFDGTDDELLFTGSGLDIFKNIGYGQAFSVVKSRETGTASRRILDVTTPATVSRYLLGDSSSTSSSFRLGGRRLDANSFSQETSSSSHSNAETLITGFLNWVDANLFLYQNGALVASDSSFQTSGNTSNTSSGSSSGIGISAFNGTMKEIVIYNTNKSTSRTGIEANINAAYSIY